MQQTRSINTQIEHKWIAILRNEPNFGETPAHRVTSEPPPFDTPIVSIAGSSPSPQVLTATEHECPGA